MKDKSYLRTHYLGLLKNHSAHDRQIKSQIIANKLWDHPQFKKADLVMFYAAMAYEVDTFGMMRKAMKEGKRVCLPIVEKNQRLLKPVILDNLDELKNSTYGILEPAFNPLKAVDIKHVGAVIVPGLAFDEKNCRLGRGAGYYDKFLSKLLPTTSIIGVAFDFQLTHCLPVDSHDIHMSCVVTN